MSRAILGTANGTTTTGSGNAPSTRGEVRSYYEVTLRQAGEAGVRRYQATRDGRPREQVAFALTHEVLAKLAGDIAG